SYGTSSRQYTTSIDVGETTTWVFSQPDPTKIYFLAVQAYNTAGLQSPYSNEVSTVPVIQPLTATSLTSNAVAQPCVGTPITFGATATGGVAPYAYKWWVFDGSTSTIGQNWSTSNTFTWTPTKPGPSYLVTVWVRNTTSTVDSFENPGATLSMTVAVGGGSPTPTPILNANPGPSTDSGMPSSGPAVELGAAGNGRNPEAKPPVAAKPAPPVPAQASPNATPSVNAAVSPARITSPRVDTKVYKQNEKRAEIAQSVSSTPPPILIVNATLPRGTGAPNAKSNRDVVTRSDGQGPAEATDRTDVGGYEILPTFEPPPPSAPAVTVNGTPTSSMNAAARHSESDNALPRSRREMRRRLALADARQPASPAPTVTSIEPDSGSSKGGTTVTITGTNFVPGAAVSFGGIPALTLVVVATSTKIVATTPSHAGGAVNVVVTNPDELSGTRTAGFSFVAPRSVKTPILSANIPFK
ncbi:MAG TPA: IPT/TIG domain-containing protein, partial [Vicinamibacterales bacterium]